MRQPTSVLVYPFCHVDGAWEVLLLRRVARPKLGLTAFWQGVTGAIKRNESLENAAARELLEETGFAPQRLIASDHVATFPIPAARRDRYAPGAEQITEHAFAAVLSEVADPPSPTLSGEHDAWRWCSLDEAAAMLHWPNNVEALRQCAAILRP
ncbi:MAG: NUDIX pyrophosphatase [Phycisphaerales bacterium]|nr:MAG: NUDIX pyrophosphatase [Phycisphaerales bacterium]